MDGRRKGLTSNCFVKWRASKNPSEDLSPKASATAVVSVHFVLSSSPASIFLSPSFLLSSSPSAALILSFILSLFRFISLSPSPPSSHPFFSLALVTRGYLSFYTPDGQVLLPLHARTPSAIISSARRCGLFSSLIRTNAGSRFHQSRLFRFLSHSLSGTRCFSRHLW